MFDRKAQTRWKTIIALEGIDGAGKTTLSKKLLALLEDKAEVFPRTKKSKGWSALLGTNYIRKNHFIQIPVYLFLNYKNYLKLLKSPQKPILIMDRCFLSHICYYYPDAMKSKTMFSLAMMFEINVMPQVIFVLDEDPAIAQKRDNYQKDLDWLKITRMNYLASCESKMLGNFNITIIPKELTIDEKANIIYNRIIELRGWEYDIGQNGNFGNPSKG